MSTPTRPPQKGKGKRGPSKGPKSVRKPMCPDFQTGSCTEGKDVEGQLRFQTCPKGEHRWDYWFHNVRRNEEGHIYVAELLCEGSGKNEKDSKVGAAGETTWKLQAKCFAKRVWPGCEGDGTMTCACTNVMAAVRRFQKTCPRVGDDLISQIERAS
eukprot:gene7007-23960_t